MILEGLTPDLGPVKVTLSRIVVKDVHGNIIGFFHDNPDGISVTCTMIGDELFAETLAQYGFSSTTIVDHLELE